MSTGPAGSETLVCIGNLTIDEAVIDGVDNGPAMGGDAAYAALGARLFLDDVRLLAPVGHDLPTGLLDDLTAAGVRTGQLPFRDLPTVRNIVSYAADGSRTWQLLCSEADFDRMSVYPADVPATVLSADGFVLSAMSLSSQLALTPWLRANTDALLYLDIQEDYLAGNRDALFEMVSCCDVFLPSEAEALALSGLSDLAAAAALFRSLGPRTVVITLAERGVLLLDGDGPAVEVPVDRVAAVDSTGAGDAFCGGFAAVHLAVGDPAAAIRAGAQAARIAVSALGIGGLLGAAQRRTIHARAANR